MCSSDNIIINNNSSRSPLPKSRIKPPARRNAKTKTQPSTTQAPAGTSSKDATRRNDASSSSKAKVAHVVASLEGWLSADESASTAGTPLPDGISGIQGGKDEEDRGDVPETILHRMLCIMQGMEADIASLKVEVVSLKATNKQQAIELADLHEKNSRLERDNEAFREEVEATVEAVEDVVTRNFKKGQELEARVEGYMEVVVDEFNRLNLRTDVLTATSAESGCDVPSVPPHGLEQIALTHDTPPADKNAPSTHKGIPRQHGHMTEAFEAPVSGRRSPPSPASSHALNNTVGSELTTRSINTRASVSIFGRDDESEDGTVPGTPSSSASCISCSTSAPFGATHSSENAETQSSQSDLLDDQL